VKRAIERSVSTLNVKSKSHILIQITGIRLTKAIDEELMDSFTTHIVTLGILICYGRYYA